MSCPGWRGRGPAGCSRGAPGGRPAGDRARRAAELPAASPPLPLTMEAGPRRPPAGRGGEGRRSASRARLGRGLSRPASPRPAASAGSRSQPARVLAGKPRPRPGPSRPPALPRAAERRRVTPGCQAPSPRRQPSSVELVLVFQPP